MIGKQKLAVRTIDQRGQRSVAVTEHVRNGKKPYRAAVIENLSPRQAVALGLALIKAGQS